jgi:hypothetical protein
VLRDARREIVRRRDVYGYDLLAWAQYKSGHIADARRSIAAALLQGTEDAMLFYHAGMIALAAGDSVDARRRLEQSLLLNPGFSATQSRIARRTLGSLGATAGAGAPGV